MTVFAIGRSLSHSLFLPPLSLPRVSVRVCVYVCVCDPMAHPGDVLGYKGWTGMRRCVQLHSQHRYAYVHTQMYTYVYTYVHKQSLNKTSLTWVPW
jgi:hypothetical protein